MAKHLKLTIKNAQIAEAINLGSLKDKLKKKKEPEPEQKEASKEKKLPKTKAVAKEKEIPHEEEVGKEEPAPRVRARSKSVFAETGVPPAAAPAKAPEIEEPVAEEKIPEPPKAPAKIEEPSKQRTGEELRRQLFGEEAAASVVPAKEAPKPKAPETREKEKIPPRVQPTPRPEPRGFPAQETRRQEKPSAPPFKQGMPPQKQPYVKLGPTGRHVKDLLPPPTQKTEPRREKRDVPPQLPPSKDKERGRAKLTRPPETTETVSEETPRKGKSTVKEFRDLKPAKRQDSQRTFDGRDRQGLRDADDEHRWRKKRSVKARPQEEQAVVRPTTLKVRTPISIKDLADKMKLKASQLISKLFLQGVVVTLNDLLEDETTIQLMGQEFGCEITIDTSEEQRIRITDKTVKEEIQGTQAEELTTRPPIVAFMGHVDHGKTSLIDAIRKSNRVAGEAGAITQHIGAFRCHTAVGDITILDTPGHEAFSAMRARGADVTDIVVLVVAGDEGIRQQTIEAIEHAKSANVTIVVAINKADKPNFNPDQVYRQLADHSLLPEVWGGQTLTVNCSAVTGAGVKELLETLALQAEVLELKANPKTRARGTVLESEMHKGLGSVATVLVQNGTLRAGDSLVFGQLWARVKTMRDEFGRDLQEAPPSTPAEITGLSGLPGAGQEFIVVANEREAREIAEVRQQDARQMQMQQRKKLTAESLALQQAAPAAKKILNVILRADVQGSLEALRVALQKIESTKAEVVTIFSGVGEVSESDIQLAATSKAVIIGFHTKIESHADLLSRQLNIQVRLHDVIYHAIDDVKLLMTGLLDKIAQETDRGKAEVRALFKSSQAGTIAGCSVIDGVIHKNHHIRVIRNGEVVATSPIVSLRRVKDDVREVAKGQECGIAINRSIEILEGDILQSFEITYLTQEL